MKNVSYEIDLKHTLATELCSWAYRPLCARFVCETPAWWHDKSINCDLILPLGYSTKMAAKFFASIPRLISSKDTPDLNYSFDIWRRDDLYYSLLLDEHCTDGFGFVCVQPKDVGIPALLNPRGLPVVYSNTKYDTIFSILTK